MMCAMNGGSTRILKNGTPAAAAALTRPDAVLAAARAQAGEIVAAAGAEAAALRARALEEAGLALEAARVAGKAEGLGQAAAALALAARARDEAIGSLEGTVVDAAVAVARRLVGRELAGSRQETLELARGALRAAAGLGDVVLRVAPADLPALRGAGDALGALAGKGTLSLAEDPTLGTGEVIVEARGGRIDGRIEARLDALRRALDAETP